MPKAQCPAQRQVSDLRFPILISVRERPQPAISIKNAHLDRPRRTHVSRGSPRLGIGWPTTAVSRHVSERLSLHHAWLGIDFAVRWSSRQVLGDEPCRRLKARLNASSDS